MQYIVPIKPSKAQRLISEVYFQIRQDFGRIVEPFTLHSPIPPLLAGVWMASRESELVGNVPREIKEAIAASVSKINQCPYCVDAHTIMIRATGEKRLAKLIIQEQYDEITPEKTRKIVKWTLSTLSPRSKQITHPPFEAREAPEIIGTALFYHYINPLVTIFLDDSPIPFPFLKSQMKQLASHLFKKAVNRRKKPGNSLALLPNRKLLKDFSWAKPSQNIAGAYSRFAGVIEDIEKAVVPKQTQEIVDQYLDEWSTGPREFGFEWIREATKKVDPQVKIATIIALLTVFSPHRLTKEIVDNFRRFFPQQNQLLGITAWASFTKTRRIGNWLKS